MSLQEMSQTLIGRFFFSVKLYIKILDLEGTKIRDSDLRGQCNLQQ